MKRSMNNIQFNSLLNKQPIDFSFKRAESDAHGLQNCNAVYEAILTRELLINDIQDNLSKYF